MKKLLYTMAITFCIMVAAPISAFAASVETAGAIGTVATTAKMASVSAYDTSVIARMNGRAGAYTLNGAKGISLEVMYSDVKNAFYNIKNGYTTKLSSSSIDEFADLITVNKNGEIVEYIQCKDGISPSQHYKTSQYVNSGKYAGAELVGTKEFAEIANAKGMSQPVTNSGISTKTTEKVANKFLGIAPSASQLAKDIAKNSGIAVAISGGVSLVESLSNGDNIYELTGNLVEDVSISAVSAAAGTVISAELPVILTSVGAGAVAANTAATVAAIAIPVAGGYALYMLADEYQLEEKVADVAEDVVLLVSDVYRNFEV